MRPCLAVLTLSIGCLMLCAQQPPAQPTISDPLVQVLVNRGILSADEARAIASGGSAAAQRDRLATLLRDKGLISDADLKAIVTAATPSPPGVPTAGTGVAQAANAPPSGLNVPPVRPGLAPPPRAVAPPLVLPAILPIRFLPVEPPKRQGLIPDIKLGTGAWMKPYGFFKTAVTHDSSSPSGVDFPLPYLNGDTGPTLDPEFHIRARSMRLGGQFEWIDPSPKWVITGRVEADFEGNFSRALNRSISSIRSNMFSLRLAYARMDRTISDGFSLFALFGQDWTPFGSSALPPLAETVGIGIGFGSLYERQPQARFGFTKSIGKKGTVKLTPEFAMVLPGFGDLPSDVANQLAYGERQGVDSGRPGFQGRFVTQWQLDSAPGVAPAQFIVSWEEARRTAIVTSAAVPTAFKSAFPNGVKVDSRSYGYTGELQLPTRWVTLLGKYYHGKDLRYHFAGQLYSNFNDTAGLAQQASGTSIDGASTVVFGTRNGIPDVAPQRGVRTSGGFINLGFPLSRIFNASPSGRNAGWNLYLHYGLDTVPARDARRLIVSTLPTGGARGKSDMAAITLQYRLNSVVTFAQEETMYRTLSPNTSVTDPGGLLLVRGIPSRQWHDIRSEFATIFTF